MRAADDLFIYPWNQPTANNCNAYLAGGVLIDPGHGHLFSHVEDGMAADQAPFPKLVVLTHCHPDHMEAAVKMQELGAKVAMHPDEAAFMEAEGRQLAASLGMRAPDLTPDIFLEEGSFQVDGEEFQVLLTPGHSPGHIVLYWPKYQALFSGDLVFVQGVGRVDFPGGDAEALKESVRRVSGLDIEVLLPGHGPALQGADQIKANFQIIEQSYFGMI